MKSIDKDLIKDFIVIILQITLFVSFIIGFGLWAWRIIQEKGKIKEEWQHKVNNCILDKNFRKDCELIIYRDIQIHNEKIEQNKKSSVLTGAIVGGMIGASAVRR
jgi:hypothetical protein